MRRDPLRSLLNLLIALGDLFFVHAGFWAAFLLRFSGALRSESFAAYLGLAPWISITVLALFWVYGLYPSRRRPWPETFYSVVSANLVIFAATIIMSYFTQGYAFPRSVFPIALGMHTLILSVWRYFVWRLGNRIYGTESVLLVGEPAEAEILEDKIHRYLGANYEIEGVVLPSLGTTADFARILPALKANYVLVCPSVDPATRAEVAAVCVENNRWLWLVPDLYEIVCSRAKLDRIEDTPIFETGGPAASAALGAKRLVDAALAALGLLVGLPVMAVMAVAIKLESPGPVFFVQERVTENGRFFGLIKFRTMARDAEKLTGPTLATRDDPRVTRVGRFLRACRLDELPQLINILKGDMSLVGPRPERPFFVEQFAKQIPNYAQRHKVKPGLTGLAQVEGKYSTSAHDKLRYDLLYSRHHSPLMDLRILLQTVRTLMMRDRSM